MKIEEQKKAVRSGYDMDIIPSDLNTYGGEAKRLLEDLSPIWKSFPFLNTKLVGAMKSFVPIPVRSTLS